MRFRDTILKKEAQRAIEETERSLNGHQPSAPKHSEEHPILSAADLRIGAATTPLATNNAPIVENVKDFETIRERIVKEHEDATLSVAVQPKRTVRLDPTAVDPRFWTFLNPQSGYCEDYRTLRTQLIHLSESKKLRSIVVTSVGPEEGKSVTALNTAWTLAEADGKRALLIDADLRKPSLDRYLGIKNNEGLSTILMGKARLEPTLTTIEPSGLNFLTAGDIRQDFSDLISGDKFKDLVEECHRKFDFTLIDTPPLSLFSDAAIMSNCVDGIVLVIQSNKVRASDLDRILDTVDRSKICGVVLNRSEETLINRDYYRYPYGSILD